MNHLFKLSIFIIASMSFTVARGIDEKLIISFKAQRYYFDNNFDDNLLYKKRSHKRRKVKRKPRRGRDNR